MQKVTVGHFVVRKLENPHILRTPIFSAAKLGKNCANYAIKYDITGVVEAYAVRTALLGGVGIVGKSTECLLRVSPSVLVPSIRLSRHRFPFNLILGPLIKMCPDISDLFNLLKPTVYMMHDHLISNNCTLCPHCIYVFCIYLRTNSDVCPIQHKLNGFITEMKSVYSAVRSGSLNKAVCACATYSIN
jgi:ferredoxin